MLAEEVVGQGVEIDEAEVKAYYDDNQVRFAEMPRVHGETFVHLHDIDYMVACDEPL